MCFVFVYKLHFILKMYKLFYILLFLICVILLSKLINVDTPKQPRILARIGGSIEKGNFSYFYIRNNGPIVLNLTSLLGDVDIYVSDTTAYPTYNPDTYTLHSATCGEEVLDIPESLDSPISVGIYGYAESSFFVLDVYESPDSSYPYKQWVTIDHDASNFNDLPKQSTESNDPVNKNKDAEILKKNAKKKRSKTNSNIPSIFSILEVIQLIFL